MGIHTQLQACARSCTLTDLLQTQLFLRDHRADLDDKAEHEGSKNKGSKDLQDA